MRKTAVSYHGSASGPGSRRLGLGLAALTFMALTLVKHRAPSARRELAVPQASSVPDEDIVQLRAERAIVGAFVADAATMGLHWIYDTRKIKQVVADRGGGQPEFVTPPAGPFYTYDSGDASPYGFEAMALLESVAEHGKLDTAAFAEHSFETLGTYEGRLNSAMKNFVTNWRKGKRGATAAAVPDDQAHGLIKVPMIVARYAGKPELLDRVAEAVRVHQVNEQSVELSQGFALVLERVVYYGDTVTQALAWAEREMPLARAKTELGKALALRKMTTPVEAAALLGQSCHLPGSFQVPLHVAATQPGYIIAVRQNALAGGDNCARAILVGALFAAAAERDDEVPADWIERTHGAATVQRLAERLVAGRAGE